MKTIKKNIYRYIAKYIGKYSDVIGVGSPELEEEVYSLAKKKPIYLENRVPNQQSIKTNFYDGESPMKVCFVGRMCEQKRPDIFVETAKITTSFNSNIRYYMAGEGNLLTQTKEYVMKNKMENIVTFVGFQTDLYGFLKQMDILFLTSEFENTPLIMLNAMNASLPIVCGDVKGVTHLIDDKKNGIIAKEFDPNSFATELIELSNNPKEVKRMSICAFNKAVGELSYEKFANAYLNVICRLGE